MAEKRLDTIIVLKNDTKANWEAVKDTVTLRVGELGIESDTGLFKIGKEKSEGVLCTWAELEYANDIPDVDLSTVTNGVKEAATLEGLGNGTVVGDIGIVKAPLYEGATTYTYTGYVWNGEAWSAMDGNYDASNVYFDSNLVMTANIGVQSLGTASSKELGTAGKSLKQVLSMILAKEEKPSITANPSVTTQIINSTTANPANKDITVEGGTTISPRWNASFSAGTYKYGPATGITPTGWEAYGYLNGNKVEGHSATSVGTQNFGAITLAAGDTYKVNAKATYDAGAIAYTNLGEEYKAGNALFDETSGAAVVQIGAGNKNDDSPAITAWQQGYYIGTLESDAEVTSDILRNVGTGAGALKNRCVKGGNYAANTTIKFDGTSGNKSMFSGTMAKFVVAYPSSVDKNTDGTFKTNKGLTKFFNNSSFEEYATNFTKSTLVVAGADNDLDSDHAVEYTVCTWTPSAAFSGSIKFEVVLS
jgi:hypothetical protein